MMNKKNVYKLFLFLFMLLAFFISVYPLLWVVIQSLKTETEFLESIWTLPARLNFQNYATAWNDAGMSRYFMNSVVVTLVTTAVRGRYSLPSFSFIIINPVKYAIYTWKFVHLNKKRNKTYMV